MKKTYIGVLIACVMGILTISSYASDIKMRKDIFYPPSSVILQEEFASGGSATGSVGALGMALGGGSGAGIVSEANRPGIFRLNTSAVSGTISRVTLYPGSNGAIQSNIPHEVLWIDRLNTNDADTAVRIGSMNSPGTDPPTRGIYFEKLNGDTNWFCVARESSVETRVDSGVTINTNFTKFFYRLTSGGAVYHIDGVAVCGTIATNLPTNTFAPSTQIVNSAAANKTIDTDYMEMKLTGMTR